MRTMRARIFLLLKLAVLLLVVGVLGLLGVRAWDSQRSPPLELWHTYSPHDLTERDIRQLDWSGYLKAENALLWIASY